MNSFVIDFIFLVLLANTVRIAILWSCASDLMLLSSLSSFRIFSINWLSNSIDQPCMLYEIRIIFPTIYKDCEYRVKNF